MSSGRRAWRMKVAYEWCVAWEDGRVDTVLAHDREQVERIARRKREGEAHAAGGANAIAEVSLV